MAYASAGNEGALACTSAEHEQTMILWGAGDLYGLTPPKDSGL